MTFTKRICKRRADPRGNGIASNSDMAQLRTSTFGEILPDLHFEAVIGSARSDALDFHARKGSRFYTSSQIERQGNVYVPTKLTEGLAQAVRFPSSSANFGSSAKLTGSMAEFFCHFGKTNGKTLIS